MFMDNAPGAEVTSSGLLVLTVVLAAVLVLARAGSAVSTLTLRTGLTTRAGASGLLVGGRDDLRGQVEAFGGSELRGGKKKVTHRAGQSTLWPVAKTDTQLTIL